jgi:hypothetical protein
MYWFESIEIHSKRFSYLYTRKHGYATQLCYDFIPLLVSIHLAVMMAVLCDVT